MFKLGVIRPSSNNETKNGSTRYEELNSTGERPAAERVENCGCEWNNVWLLNHEGEFVFVIANTENGGGN
jgi:hypothetical protein